MAVQNIAVPNCTATPVATTCQEFSTKRKEKKATAHRALPAMTTRRAPYRSIRGPTTAGAGSVSSRERVSAVPTATADMAVVAVK
ncbi:hypothetical protein RB201_28595 [Streptomyces sp. S1A(2023)]